MSIYMLTCVFIYVNCELIDGLFLNFVLTFTHSLLEYITGIVQALIIRVWYTQTPFHIYVMLFAVVVCIMSSIDGCFFFP